MALGIFIGIGILIVLYVISMLLYFAIRKRWSSAKYAVELLFVLAALCFSLGVKMAIFISLADKATIGSGIAVFFQTIYAGIGGLGFEGLGEYDLSTNVICCLYPGSSVYAGLMFVSVMTAKASYEIYSGMLLLLLRIRRVLKCYREKTDVCIFTAATEDSLLLANSINERYKSEKKDVKIIFAGESLEAFEKKDPEHREIMANGYLYWPYLKARNNKRVSIINRLGLKIYRNTPSSEKDKMQKIMIFALENNEKLSGLEVKNGSVVFEEIESILRTTKGKKYLDAIIDFYILTDSSINYEYYQRETESIIHSVLQSEVNGEKNPAERYKKHFQMHTVNEAVLAGKDLALKRIEMYKKEEKEGNKSIFLADNKPIAQNGNVYRAMVLGFGKIGEESMKNLFIDSAYIYNTPEERGYSSQFIADIYDTKTDEKSGVFSMTHPLFVCTDYCDDNVIDDESMQKLYGEKLDKIYKKYYDGSLKNAYSREEFYKLMGFPILHFHTTPCFGLSFIEFLDTKMGADISEDGVKNKIFAYNSFIVTLGDDELNITIANALIDDFKHEIYRLDEETSKNIPLQTIYVNVRDENNYGRINWTEEDERRFPGLKVVLFGKRTDLYSYAGIVDVEKSVKYNLGYNMIQSDDNFVRFKDAIDPKQKDKDYFPVIRELTNKMNKLAADQREAYEKWYEISMFLKESNDAAGRFGPYFSHYFSERKKLPGDDFSLLAELEHNRWNRFHIANGWTYAYYHGYEKKNRRSNKEHTCLCPYASLDYDTRCYDLINVAMSCEKD